MTHISLDNRKVKTEDPKYKTNPSDSVNNKCSVKVKVKEYVRTQCPLVTSRIEITYLFFFLPVPPKH